jgi:hypothetical protein
MRRTVLALACLCVLLLQSGAARAWGYQGHEVVGAIAGERLTDHAKDQVQQILNGPPPADVDLEKALHVWHELTLKDAGPWADCVKSVARHDDGRFHYELSPTHPEYEKPCIPFNSALERARMEDYAKHNWSTCSYKVDGVERGCHNTFHFEDVAIQRDGFDRSDLGTNDHDLVAAINAAIAVLTDRPIPPPFPFAIRDKKEALLLLTHFLGDLHQPLHVGAVYLDPQGAAVDPDAAHAIDPATETAGANLIQDQNLNLHGEWDDIPTDIGEASTCELRQDAATVAATPGPIDGWAAQWATDTLHVAQDAFQHLTFAPPNPPSPQYKWSVAFDDHMAYLRHMDEIKRHQLAKAGARLAQILNTIWP